MDFSEQESDPVLGLSLAVYSKGKPILVKGYGFANNQQKIPVTEKTVFRVGSITKQFTAAGVMALVEDKRLSLSDSVHALLPEYEQIPREVTVEHLLAHTSGIFNYTSLPNWPELENKNIPRTKFVEMFLDKPLDFKPGTGWRYSNSGYYLLGLIVEKISGMSYRDFVKERLINRAKLKHTDYCSPSMEGPYAAKGYLVDKKQWVEAPPISIDHPYSAGGLCSTAEDLAVWATALMRGEIISSISLQQMITPVPRKDKKQGSQVELGWGFMMSNEMGHRFVGSGGAINGFINALDTYPDDELVVVSLSNTESSTGTMLGVTLARSVLGLVEDKAITENQAKELEGIYQRSEDGAGFQLSWSRGKLFYTRTENGKLTGPALRMLAQGEDKFIINENSAVINIVKTSGKVTGASFLLLGGEQKFLKAK
jgi:CubicO group peptidase (beta-lactamase class C family)